MFIGKFKQRTVASKSKKSKNPITLLTVIATILLILLFYYFFTYSGMYDKTQMKSIKSLTYTKRGGVKGVYNILEIRKPNEAIYTCIFSPRFGNKSFVLSVNESEVDLLFGKIMKEYAILNYNGKIYKPRKVFDYFTHEIFLVLENGETIKVEWVDEWASEESIPKNLVHVKETVENFIRRKTLPCE
jgi:hypothetical protein